MTKVTKILVSIAALAALSAPVFAQDDQEGQTPPAKAAPSAGLDVQAFKECLHQFCVPDRNGAPVCFDQTVKDTPNADPTSFGGQIHLPSMQAVTAHPLWKKYAAGIHDCRTQFGL